MNKGSTLVEILIYIAILGIVVSSFISFSVSISDSRGKVYVEQEVQANARVALNLITQKILSSNGLNVGTSVFDVDPGSLSLSMADGAKNPTIISLLVDDGQLQIQEGLGVAVPITSDEVRVTNLVFTNLTSTSDKANIKIELTVEYITTGSVVYNYPFSLETAVSLRQ
ncbi:MAG: prepilin-type N-terminal cleavage/methylation domain-containing protein [Candidatus Pacebacteria bacterium]|nr:prepilin-type N-terminal cleavage/methylation domain-containing protein [Candidatus Paceibacterota bacterium]